MRIAWSLFFPPNVQSSLLVKHLYLALAGRAFAHSTNLETVDIWVGDGFHPPLTIDLDFHVPRCHHSSSPSSIMRWHGQHRIFVKSGGDMYTPRRTSSPQSTHIIPSPRPNDKSRRASHLDASAYCVPIRHRWSNAV